MRRNQLRAVLISVAVMFMATEPCRAGETYAVLVGVGDYKTYRDLKGPENDIAYMQQLLTDEKAGLGVPLSHITSLVSESATKSEIQSAITDIHRSRKSDDLLIFYFSGHGALLESENIGSDGRRLGEPCLLPYEAKGRARATFIGLHDDLAGWLSSVHCQKVVLLDACYTDAGDRGASVEGEGSRATLDLGIATERSLESAANVVVYASGMDGADKPQPSYDRAIEGKTYGAFTHAFGSAVRSLDEGRVTVELAATDAAAILRARPANKRQTPVVGPPGAPQVLLVDRDVRTVHLSVSQPVAQPVEVRLGDVLYTVQPGATVRVPGVRAGMHRLYANVVSQPGVANAYTDWTDDIQVPQQTKIEIILPLRTGHVSGWVVDEGRNAIVGAEVHLRPQGPLPPGAVTMTKTDGEGAFSIDAALSTYAGVSVIAPGYDPLREEWQGKPLGSFTVSGRSTDRIWIFVRRSPSTFGFERLLHPDFEVYVDGSLTAGSSLIVNVTSGVEHAVEVRRHGYETVSFVVPVLKPGERHAAPAVNPSPLPASIKVIATDRDTGAVIRGARVTGPVRGDTGDSIAVARAGRIRLMVTHPLYAPSDRFEVDVAPGAQVEHAVTLRRRTGVVRVSADIDGVQISMDGKSLGEVGATGTAFTVPVGDHRLTARREGHEVDHWSPSRYGSKLSTYTVSVSHQEATSATVYMRAIPATLVVVTDRDHLSERRQVLVDGRPVGTTPYRGSVVIGQHTISVRIYDGEHIAGSASEARDIRRGENRFRFTPHVTPGMVTMPAAAADIDSDGYYIDRYEVTVREYRDFLARVDREGNGKFSHPEQPLFQVYEPRDWGAQLERLDAAVHGVSWYAAYAYAQAQQKRLPTEAEWIRAVRCHDSQIGLARKRRASVREWVDSYFHEDYPNPKAGAGLAKSELRVVRACPSSSSPRVGMLPTASDLTPGFLGFRCARDID